VLNPFKIFVIIGVVIALVLAAGFVYVFFFNPGNHGSLNVTSAQVSSVETA
jgi:flagellar basal body-associated protein FliL